MKIILVNLLRKITSDGKQRLSSSFAILVLLITPSCTLEGIFSPSLETPIVASTESLRTQFQTETPTPGLITSTRTVKKTRTRRPTETNTPTRDPLIPDIMIQGSQINGWTPEELWHYYLLIHNALVENDPLPYTKLILYPLSICSDNHPGTVASKTKINTAEDFLEVYPFQMIEKYRSYLSKEQPEDLLYTTTGLGFGHGEIWLMKLDDTIYLTSFMDYCHPLTFGS